MVFMFAKCPQCKHRERDEQGKDPGRCSRCGSAMEWMKPKGSSKPYWYVRVKGVTKAVGPIRSQAVEEEAKILTDHVEGRSSLSRMKPMLWSTAAKRFATHIKTHNKPRTAEFYAGQMKVLKKFFGENKYLHEICRGDIDDLVEELQGKVSETSINRAISTLRRFLSWGFDRGHTYLNVASKYPTFYEKPRDRVFTAEEVERLLESCLRRQASPLLYPIVVVALDSGLRRYDIINLKTSELDFKAGFIRKETCVKQRRPHEVHIPMTNRVRTLLREHLDRQGSTGEFVFQSPRYPDRPLNYKSEFGFKTAMKKAGIEDGIFHDLRRTFATRWAEQDGDMKTLQILMDHSSIEITAKIYTKVSEARKRQQMGRFEHETNINNQLAPLEKPVLDPLGNGLLLHRLRESS